MINNTELQSCLQTLAQFTLSLYYKHLPPDKLKQYEEHIRVFALTDLDSEVKENPMFAECVAVMEKDEHIKALNGKLVGTPDSSSIIQDNMFTILSFLSQLYISNPTYDQDLFNQAYSSFEELFYSDVLRIRDTSRLNNFQSNSSLIELGHGINMRKVPIQRVIHTASERMQSWVYAKPYISDFIIERLYERRKIIGDISKLNENDSLQGLSKTGELFDFVISAFRILKPSAVFRDATISSELLTFHPMPSTGTMYTMPLSETIVLGEKCVIEEKDIPELKNIFTFLIAENDSRFNVAQRRLRLSMERSSLEDRLIDYMIGLETLYLPDGNQELSFRLSLRMAFLLCSAPSERKETYYFVRNIYNTRSNIVHGNKYNLVKDEIDKFEELLRKSLKLWLNDKSNFSKKALSNIFFPILN
ncbi:MAG: hypothetical protein HW402_361 [Dehalococcoidales bacterium]|nr:hypothetical protein [Dehalococcoidales bacterium]